LVVYGFLIIILKNSKCVEKITIVLFNKLLNSVMNNDSVCLIIGLLDYSNISLIYIVFVIQNVLIMGIFFFEAIWPNTRSLTLIRHKFKHQYVYHKLKNCPRERPKFEMYYEDLILTCNYNIRLNSELKKSINNKIIM